VAQRPVGVNPPCGFACEQEPEASDPVAIRAASQHYPRPARTLAAGAVFDGGTHAIEFGSHMRDGVEFGQRCGAVAV